ncbi:MAG: FecR family protein [Chitinophagaceae bacterium]|nr:FecR family protein [Chitinophagaceae bacterium]
MAELGTLLQQYPELGLRAEVLNTIFQPRSKSQSTDKDISFNRHLQRLSNHFSEPVLQYENAEQSELIEQPRIRPFIRKKLLWITGFAASILIVWFVAIYVPGKNNQPKTSAQNTVSTKRGSKSKIQLPDGTQVWLNADSKITYNENFQGALREVQLTGEAFFDVVRDESRPFVIHANAIDVRVLGTAFNVRSYENEKKTETSLIHGSVEITLRNSPDNKYILKPNEKLIVQNDNLQLLAEKDATKKSEPKKPILTLAKINYQEKDTSALETLWVKNKLAFDGETFEEIALKIERWYDVKVNINDDRIRKVEFSGIFEDENLQQVMEALQITGKFKYNIYKREVTIGR